MGPRQRFDGSINPEVLPSPLHFRGGLDAFGCNHFARLGLHADSGFILTEVAEALSLQQQGLQTQQDGTEFFLNPSTATASCW